MSEDGALRVFTSGSTDVIYGLNALAAVTDLVADLAPSSCLLVRGGKSFETSTAHPTIDAVLRLIPRTQVVRSQPHQLQLVTVEEILIGLAGRGWDLIIGVGGGATLDLAKIIAAFGCREPVSTKRTLSMIASDGLPDSREGTLVLIPTTAGTGCEMTPFATVWDGGRKLSLESRAMLPDHAIVDPSLSQSCPIEVAVSAAADALCQAAESHWSTRSTEGSRSFANQALVAAAQGAAQLVSNPSLRPSSLAWSALCGGRAIAVSRTTAAHAASYALTAKLGIQHGAAALMNLDWVADLNSRVSASTCEDVRGPKAVADSVEIVRETVVASTGYELAALSRSLLTIGGFAPSVADLPTRTRWVDAWISSTISSPRMNTNPSRVTESDMLSVLSGC